LSAPFLDLNVPAVDMVGPLVAAKVLGVTGAILIFIVVFASLASSLDSLLAATSDLIVEDIFRKHFAPNASDQTLRKASMVIVFLLGFTAWIICWQRPTHLFGMISFSGALVGSTIWPIAAGLYWRKTNPLGATLGMIFGSVVGLWTYFAIGFYVAALVGAAVSMLIVLISTLVAPKNFNWKMLDEKHAS